MFKLSSNYSILPAGIPYEQNSFPLYLTLMFSEIMLEANPVDLL